MNQPIQLRALNLQAEQPNHHEPLAIALALVKNEGDIISYWLSHISELFDLVYIVDHQSTDGTREFLVDMAKSETNIHLYSFDHPGYFQSEITNHLAQLVAQKHPSSWLFPLDADEFLNVPSKEEFISLVGKQDPEQILLLNWQNCVPIYLNSDQQIQPNFACLFPPHPGTYNKVAINCKTLVNRNLSFIQGNHSLKSERGQINEVKQSHFLNLYHLPIRSVDHFALKCNQGYIAYDQLPPERKSTGQGSHWKDMIDSVLTVGFLDANTIRKFTTTYGQQNDLDSVNIYKLIDLGWKVDSFVVPFNQSANFHSINRNHSFRELTQQLLKQYPQYIELQGFSRIVDESQKRIADMSLWQKGNNNILTFNKLPELSKDNAENSSYQVSSDIEILNTFFSRAFTPRENSVPSTWEGHVPFLYCLLDFARPRRFVELGSQYGNCFFAACQMSKLLSDSIECIAIDMWVGDEHTGTYQEDVYRQFSRILHRDYPNGKHIRKFFADAISQFESGSIDLLHIDGLHTYEAVADDFQTWLPKLSDRGIVMFHDTQVRERDFGVWKLWSQVSGKYPSFEFLHSHGLGVLLVGEQAEAHIKKLFKIASQFENLEFLRFFFSSIGQISPLTKK